MNGARTTGGPGRCHRRGRSRCAPSPGACTMAEEHVGLNEMARRMGLSIHKARAVAATEGIRTLAYPGQPVRYNAADIDAAVARASGVAQPPPRRPVGF